MRTAVITGKRDAKVGNQYAEILRNTAKEVRDNDILGWGNACEFGADEIERLSLALRLIADGRPFPRTIAEKAVGSVLNRQGKA